MRFCIYIPMWLIWAGGGIASAFTAAFIGFSVIALKEQLAPVQPAVEFKHRDMAKHERMGGTIESEWEGLARDLGEK